MDDNKYVPSKRGLAPQTQPKEILPPRKSLRLQRIDPESGLQLPDKEPTKYFNPSSIDSLSYQKSRHELKDLKLSEFLAPNVQSEDAENISNYLTRISSSLNLPKKDSKDSNFGHDISQRLKELRITEEQVAKVSQTRIYSLAVHPTDAKLLVAAGGKIGDLGIWDVNDETMETHGVNVFWPHVRSINCLTFNEHLKSKLISTSYDGTMRSFDLENQISEILYGLPDDGEDGYLTSHCQKDPSTFLLAGRLGYGKHGTGFVGVVDARTPNLKFAHEFAVYNGGSARTVSLHPTKRDLFVCQGGSGNAAPCMLFDMRGKKSSNNIMTPVTRFLGHTKSIGSAYLSPLTGEKLATVCMDDKIRIYDVDNQAQHKSPSVEIRHNNNTGRWLTRFRVNIIKLNLNYQIFVPLLK